MLIDMVCNKLVVKNLKDTLVSLNKMKAWCQGFY